MRRVRDQCRRVSDHLDVLLTDVSRTLPVPSRLDDVLAELDAFFHHVHGFHIRRFTVPEPAPQAAALAFLEGISDDSTINDLLDALTLQSVQAGDGAPAAAGALDSFRQRLVPVGECRTASRLGQVLQGILEGDTALLVDGVGQALIVSTRARVGRQVDDASTEPIAVGPKEAFTELLEVNLALIRKRLRHPSLKIELSRLGRFTRTRVAVLYLEGVARADVVDEARRRLARIRTDGLVDAGQVAEWLSDSPWSPFPTLLRTERPDRVVANLLEGKVAVLVDGSPFAITAPMLFVQLLHAAEDHYVHPLVATVVRLLRLLALATTTGAPAVYVAVSTLNQEVVPTGLLLHMAAGRSLIPYPTVVETLVMVSTFEIMREAGVRLPRAVGQAVSIVGALVLGDAAVRAGLASPLIVIVVGITAIASFALPGYESQLLSRFLGLPFIGLAAVLGVAGIAMGLVAVLLHLASLRSLGVPYLTPIGPFRPRGWRDALVRAPSWSMTARPPFVGRANPRRQAPPVPAAPPQAAGKRG